MRTVSVLRPLVLRTHFILYPSIVRFAPPSLLGGRAGFCGDLPLSLQVARPAPFTESVLSASLGLVCVSRGLPRRRCWDPVPFADSALLALLARVILPACFVGVCPFALVRGFHAFFVGFRSCRSDLPVAKTKISLFLQLFCDCGSLSASERRKWAAKQRILLRFCSVIGIQGSRNNPQSQKSCRKPGFFVFSLPWTAS